MKLAQHYGEVDITGRDPWGEDWEYSKGVCEKNAHLGGVSDRVHFQKGDASRLNFADDLFDGATSNLTFHEVKSAMDPRLVVQEALRVIKPGGKFSFIDYIYEEKHYGTQEEFENFIKGIGRFRF